MIQASSSIYNLYGVISFIGLCNCPVGHEGKQTCVHCRLVISSGNQ